MNYHIKNRHIPDLPAELKREALNALALGAEWLVRNQVRDAWPNWNANKGRFPYHVFIDPAKQARKPMHLSTCWKTARPVQGLFSAYSVTGDKATLATARLGLAYVMSLQVLDPALAGFVGTFREDSPLGPHVAIRDGVEAVQALINGYIVTGDRLYLHRARLYTDWFLANMHSRRFPTSNAYPEENRYLPLDRRFEWIQHAAAIIFAQMAALTGRKDYVTRGAVPLADATIRRFILPSGALGLKPGGKAAQSHHITLGGPLANVFTNDDGAGAALFCAYAATGRPGSKTSAVITDTTRVRTDGASWIELIIELSIDNCPESLKGSAMSIQTGNNAVKYETREGKGFVTVGGGEPREVRVKFTRPLTDRSGMVVFVDDKEREVASVAGLTALDPASRAAAAAALDLAYLITRITRVDRTRTRMGVRFWEVQTDRGPRTFAMKDPTRNVLAMDDGRMVLWDTLGNCFEIPSYAALDAHSRKQVDRIV
ncbi:MAG: DUF1854 domain-containing protein [Planctomycetota bacterium]